MNFQLSVLLQSARDKGTVPNCQQLYKVALYFEGFPQNGGAEGFF
jgi:hypothetical protein